MGRPFRSIVMTHKMTIVEHVEAARSSLSLFCCDGTYYVSCIRLTANGELDHDVELYAHKGENPKLAAQLYLEIEAALKMAERFCYRARPSLIQGIARMTITNHHLNA